MRSPRTPLDLPNFNLNYEKTTFCEKLDFSRFTNRSLGFGVLAPAPKQPPIKDSTKGGAQAKAAHPLGGGRRPPPSWVDMWGLGRQEAYLHIELDRVMLSTCE